MDIGTPLKEGELSLIKKYPIETVLLLLILAVTTLTWYVAGLEKDFRSYVINQGEQTTGVIKDNSILLQEVKKNLEKK